MKLFLLSALVSLGLAHDGLASEVDADRRLHGEEMTIYSGFASPPANQIEVLSVVAPLYSDGSATEQIGSMALACPKIEVDFAEIFNPCTIYFYFHGPDGVGTTEDAIVATGWSVIGNITTFAPPLMQGYAITGGFGKYAGATGYMEDNYDTNPGINTFTVHLGADAASRERHLSTKGEIASPKSALRRLESNMIYTGFKTPVEIQKEILRVYADIYSDPSMTQVVGTFGLTCPIFSAPFAEIFNPCNLYFYFHGEEGIGATTDAIMANGWSIIGNISDFTQQPLLQLFAVEGGLGSYVGAGGYLEDNYLANPGINTFTDYHTSAAKRGRNLVTARATGMAKSTLSRRLGDNMTIVTGFLAPDETQKEVLRGYAPIYADGSATDEIGTFGLACTNLASDVIEIYSMCSLYFYFHETQEGLGNGIASTKNAIMAAGWSVIANLKDFNQEPIMQKFAITSGLGEYMDATGWLENNYLTNPGYNTFTVYFGAANDMTETVAPASGSTGDAGTPPAGSGAGDAGSAGDATAAPGESTSNGGSTSAPKKTSKADKLAVFSTGLAVLGMSAVLLF